MMKMLALKKKPGFYRMWDTSKHIVTVPYRLDELRRRLVESNWNEQELDWMRINKLSMMEWRDLKVIG